MVNQSNTLPADLRISYRIPTIFNRHDVKNDANENQPKRRKRVNKRDQKIGICRFSPFEPLIAIVMQDDCSVYIWSYEEQNRNLSNYKFGSTSKQTLTRTIEDSQSIKNDVKLVCIIRHTRPIDFIIWLDQHPSANQGQTRILMTRTKQDQVYRVWTTTIDDMQSMHLTAIVEQPFTKDQLMTNNNDILGLSIEQWDQVQRKRSQMRDSKGDQSSTLYVWRDSLDSHEQQSISLLAMANELDLKILSPQKLSLWQRSLLSCGIATKSTKHFSLKEQSQKDKDLFRMGIIANLNLLSTSKNVQTLQDDSIKDLHWISDDHILIGMQNDERAILIDGTKMLKNSKINSDPIDKNDQQKQNSLSNIAKNQSLPLPFQHLEVLIRCAYWGQLSMSMQIILKACIDEQDGIQIEDAETQKSVWPQKTLIIESSPAERQMEMIQSIRAEEEKLEIIRKASDGEGEDLAHHAINVIVKEQQSWNKIQGNSNSETQKKDEDVELRNKTSTVVNMLFDLRKLIGQLDNSAIRFVVNAFFSNLYYGQTLSSPFAIYESPEKLSQTEVLSTLSGRADADPLLTKSCLHAWFSSTQEALFQYIESTFLTRISSNGSISTKMDWKLARKLGIFLWFRSNEKLRLFAESIAKVQYTEDEKNDPTSCSLFYYALGKQKLVQNLWRQAVWHSEYNKMMKFLQNDFLGKDSQRWRSAACKNAFVLLSQRRFEMAAAFFLLGDSLQDAINVCIRNLFDISLAIAICRIWHNEKVGQEVFKNLILQVILPNACKNNDRFTILWSTEILERRDLSIIIIQSSDLNSASKQIADALNVVMVKEEDESNQDLNALKDVDDLFFYKAIISPQSTSDELGLVEMATDTLRQDGMGNLAECFKRDWKFNDQKTKVNPTYKLFDGISISTKPIAQLQQSEENVTSSPSQPSTTKPAPATQLVKSDLATKQTSSVSDADLAFDLDSFGM